MFCVTWTFESIQFNFKELMDQRKLPDNRKASPFILWPVCESPWCQATFQESNIPEPLWNMHDMRSRSSPPLLCSSLYVTTCHFLCYPVYQPVRWQKRMNSPLKLHMLQLLQIKLATRRPDEKHITFMMFLPNDSHLLFTLVAVRITLNDRRP